MSFGRKKERNYKAIPKYLTVLLTICVVLAQLGSFSWFFELFSHFAVQYTIIAVILFFICFVLKQNLHAALAFILVLINLIIIRPMWQDKPETTISEDMILDKEEISVLQYNVRGNNENREDVVRFLIEKSDVADIILLFEVNKDWEPHLEAVRWLYPYSFKMNVRKNHDILVMSKLMINEFKVVKPKIGVAAVPFISVKGETWVNKDKFTLYAMHPPPPMSPFLATIRNNTLDMAASLMKKERSDYKIIVGDLNITSFSPYFSKLINTSGLYNSNVGLGYVMTWPSVVVQPFGIAIDQLLLSKNIVVLSKERDKARGSDHFPIFTKLELLKMRGK